MCRAASIALTGIEGTAVYVEAAVSNQLPGMAIVGLPDAALAEAKQRVKLAVQHSNLSLTDRFLVINLSPAALPKHGSGFDLAIALSALAASKKIPTNNLSEIAHIGELGLDGELRRPNGLLTSVLAAQQIGFTQVMVPKSCAAEAALVPGIDVIPVTSLASAVAWYRGEQSLDGVSPEPEYADRNLRVTSHAQSDTLSIESFGDISDVIGQPEAVEALTIAAAGRHHMAMVGPPGAGKTLLATRLVTILPDLDNEDSIVASSIASLSGAVLHQLVRRPPFIAPHHTATKVSLIGGGDSRGAKPGAITRASYGVLFLDEAPEFSREVLDSLRQPLESGVINIDRSNFHAQLPARAQLILAANPCPCGYADSLDPVNPCTCTPKQKMSYFGRISGPLADRIDVRFAVRRVTSVHAFESNEERPTSQQIRSRVAEARARAKERLINTPWNVNSEVSGEWLRSPSQKLPRSATAIIDAALARGSLTVRGYDRVLRLAWTVADLAGTTQPDRSAIRKALLLREGAN